MTFNLTDFSINDKKIDVNATFPRWFEPFLKPNPWKVAWGGRGGGKTICFARLLLIMGIQKPLRILCTREFMASMQDSVWQTLVDEINALKLNDYYEIEKGVIRSKNPIHDPNDPLSKKFTQFRFQGIRANVNQIKSFAKIDICWCEEAANISKKSWDILTPTIHRTGMTLDQPEIWVSFNPDSPDDATYKMFVTEPKYPTALVVKCNYYDNPWYPPSLQEEMEITKAYSEDDYRHIYLGEPKKYLDGAVYKEELRQAEARGAFTNVEYDPLGGPVEAFWDLGIADATAIWLAQRVGREVRLLNYVENQQKGLDFYLMVLGDKKRYPYPIERMWLPHDARAREYGSGRSVEEILKSKGFRVSIVPRLSIADGIGAVRGLMPFMFFDEANCEQGIKCLRNYRYEVKDKMGGLKSEPVHDRYSHGSDAMRYLAVALKPPKVKGDGGSNDASWAMFNRRSHSWMDV